MVINKGEVISECHPLIQIGIFIVVFQAIHPFKHGNGWHSRVLTTLLPLRAGVPGCCSIKATVGASEPCAAYYLSVRG